MKNISKSQLKYLMAVADSASNPTVTVLANYLNCSKPSVVRGLQKLAARELVNYDQAITLTKQGLRYVENIKKTDQILYHFLVNVLSVDAKHARQEVENIRHAVSCETLQSLTEFLRQNLAEVDLQYCDANCNKCQF